MPADELLDDAAAAIDEALFWHVSREEDLGAQLELQQQKSKRESITKSNLARFSPVRRLRAAATAKLLLHQARCH